MVGAIVYILCGIFSFACSYLLYQAYRRRQIALLLWSALCFAGLTLNNILLFIDIVVTSPEVDLSLFRGLTTLVAVWILIFGLIWDAA